MTRPALSYSPSTQSLPQSLSSCLPPTPSLSSQSLSSCLPLPPPHPRSSCKIFDVLPATSVGELLTDVKSRLGLTTTNAFALYQVQRGTHFLLHENAKVAEIRAAVDPRAKALGMKERRPKLLFKKYLFTKHDERLVTEKGAPPLSDLPPPPPPPLTQENTTARSRPPIRPPSTHAPSLCGRAALPVMEHAA